MATHAKTATFLPTNEVAQLRALAAELAVVAGPHLPESPEPAAYLSATDGARIPLPHSVLDALHKVVEAMSQGMAVTVVPTHTQLTTQQAADLLGLSRPTVVKLCEQGELRFTAPNRHRRVQLAEVLAYQERLRRRQATALRNVAAISEDLDLYDFDAADYQAALEEVRAERGKRRSEQAPH